MSARGKGEKSFHMLMAEEEEGECVAVLFASHTYLVFERERDAPFDYAYVRAWTDGEKGR